MRPALLRSAGLGAALLLATPPGVAWPQPREVASEDVPAAVETRARRLAEAAPRAREFLARGRTIYIGTELVREKGPEGEDVRTPRYLVTHYRYDDDTAVLTFVDVARNAVAEAREVRHLPVRLTTGELERARGLAFADGRVRAELGEFAGRVTVEPLLVRTADERDPWFGRRVVRLLFRVGPDYLTRPIVYVDLTSGRVQIGEENR